ncbi:hypothetical protein DFA_09583 [Cavenderia fasciculata]|uniref:ComC supersandwich domain-containing protein n=1 Tax=Cavenderia fasciculata TaxID=261658 RepID=F4Q812_CACFS|nr:uncharacterized protein DFA_09583 [Cavenderia fasciculata]EGG15912.1 hypothetical protein DFA_09583 [Cavenderia fasciculata]|eukprot:XP_004352237.1 hypothetical protein DFA_09583 [Cavenderia fasciculata]
MIRNLLTFSVIFIVLSCCDLQSNAQSLPQEELDSIIWLIRQYKAQLPQDQTICNYATSTAFVNCTTLINGFNHISDVGMIGSFDSGATLQPDPNLNTFTMPYLKSISLRPTGVMNVALNTLSRMSNLPLLTKLYIQSDPSITSIPASLSSGGLPKLESLTLYQISIASLKAPFFDKSPIYTMIIHLTTGSEFIIDSSWNHPNVSILSISMAKMTNPTISFDLSSLFNLTTFEITCIDPSSVIPLDIDNQHVNSLKVMGSGGSLFNVNFITIPSKLTEIVSTGSVTWANDLKDLPSITHITFYLSTISTIPWSQYPKTLTYLQFKSCILSAAIPNSPLPLSMNRVYLENVTSPGNQPIPVPWNIFNNTQTILSITDTLLTGTVPDLLCSSKFSLLKNVGTTLTIPDCFWCYSNDTAILTTTLVKPTGFVCNYKTDSTNVYLINGTAKVFGDLIGWGTAGNTIYGTKTYNLVATPPNIPNKELTFSLVGGAFNYAKITITSLFNNKTPQLKYSWNVLEVGIVINNATAPTIEQIPTGIGYRIPFTLFNPFAPHIVTIDNTYPCDILLNSSSFLYCTSVDVGGGNHTITIANERVSKILDFSFAQLYPLVTSFLVDSKDNRNISLYGYYGPNLDKPTVYLNGSTSLSCKVMTISTKYMDCYLDQVPAVGTASVTVIVDTFVFTRPDALYFSSSDSGSDSEQECMDRTNNCNGHGQCNSQGECDCEPLYNPDDDCATKYTNTTPIIDPTKPTTSFDIDGIDFQFEIVAVQELDMDENIIKEVPTDLWISNVTINTTLTVADYQLIITNRTIIGPLTNVFATISFSSIARTIPFGPQTLSLKPSAIKVAVNISQWSFQDNLTYLRVVFRTTINNNQTVRRGCKEIPIESLSFDEYGSTLQYLRVVKDNIQFSGRFIDYSMSDGRPTYSRTQLISLLPNSDQTTSNATIGILLSQCKECLLDPDFTPLLIDKDSNNGCDKSNNTWRIIVGCVVGGMAAIAIATGSIMLMNRNPFCLWQSPIAFSIIFIMMLSCCSNAQTLPQEERRQYKAQLPQDQTICNYNLSPVIYVYCAVINGVNHITDVAIIDSFDSGATLQPDPNLNTFTMPYLNSISLRPTGVMNVALNTLSRMSNLPLLTRLYIQSDPSITSIPASLSSGGLPKLESITFYDLSSSVKAPFFDKSPLYSLLISINTASAGVEVSIDSSWNQPNISSITLTLRLTNPILSFDLSKLSNLTTFYLYSSGPFSSTFPLNINHQKLSELRLTGESGSSFNVNFITIPSKLTQIYSTGSVTWANDLKDLPSITHLSFTLSTISTIPWSQYPKTLTYLHFKSCILSAAIPNSPLPLSMNRVYLENVTSPGNQPIPVPWNIFNNTQTILSITDTLLTGTVPDLLCSSKFSLLNNVGTTLTIPDCFWCYSNDTAILTTTLVKPTGFVCNYKTDSTNVYLINGVGKVLGDLIGWGTVGNTIYGTRTFNLVATLPNIPNKELTFRLTAGVFNAPKTTVTSLFNNKSPQITYTLNVLEVGIVINNATAPTIEQIPTGIGYRIPFTLFNPFAPHNVTIDNKYPCNILLNSSTFLYCTSVDVGGGNHTITIANERVSKILDFTFAQLYPLVNSFVVDSKDSRNISLYGYYGPNLDKPTVYLNGSTSLSCKVMTISTNYMDCYLDQVPAAGTASVTVIVDTFVFARPDALYFSSSPGSGSGGSGSDIEQECMDRTNNCNGHGQCNSQGECDCEPLYNPDDDCATKYTNTTPIIDPTKPTTSFDIDGIDFQFEIVAVQELDMDENIIKEVPTDLWISNVTINTTLTVADYQLNITNRTIIGPLTNVFATISFSSQSRTVPFGPQTLSIKPSAIKVAVNISQWSFQDNLSYLRVVFRTTINNNQTVTRDCKEIPIESLSFDEYGSTLQYLRVVKENVQLSGRFIDYSMSDGRPTYSRTQLISLLPNSDQTTSNATIGILLSQCKECLLDPDFTPLLIDKDSNNGCDKSNNTWRIIVGCVVGGMAAIAIATGSIMFFNILVNSQILPTDPDEVISVQWLIAQYQSKIPPTNFCNVSMPTYQYIVCSEVDGGMHVTSISLSIDSGLTTGAWPDPELKKFTLPYVTMFSVSNIRVKNASLNVLDLMVDMPRLTKLLLLKDPQIRYIPATLSAGLPALERLDLLELPGLTKIEHPFLYGSPKLNFITIYGIRYLIEMRVNSSWYLPSLEYLQFTVNFTDPSLFDLVFTEQSFPKMTKLDPKTYAGSPPPVDGYLDIKIGLPKLIAMYPASVLPTKIRINFIQYPSSNTFQLTSSGNIEYLPSGLDLINSTLLSTFNMRNGNFSEYFPIVNQYPQQLGFISIENSYLPTGLPAIPPNPSMKTVTITDTFMQTFPWDSFGNSTTTFHITNTNLTGSIPSSFCSNKLPNLKNIFGDQLLVPDCFWCYANDTTIFSTTLPTPTTIDCGITLESNDIYLINGTGFIRGKNIGWGIESAVTPTGQRYSLGEAPSIPNQELKLLISPIKYSVRIPITIALNAKTSYVVPITILEVGIAIGPVTVTQLPTGLGLKIQFYSFNPFINSVVMVDNNSTCTIMSNSTYQLYCTVPATLPGPHNLSVTNEYYGKSVGFVYQQTYPLVNSFHYDRSDYRNVSLYGFFGATLGQPLVYLNETTSIGCTVKVITKNFINCYLDAMPPGGMVSVSVNVDIYSFTRHNAMSFTYSNQGSSSDSGSGSDDSKLSPKDKCMQDTHNCYGHGQCDENGQCQCEPDYLQIDDYTNTTPIVDPTKPTTSFDIDGIDFEFEIVSIQELDVDDTIVKELPTDLWQSVINETATLTTANYLLNITNSTDREMNQNLEVRATISFSSQARTVAFGPQQLDINPNAIKVAVNISNWDFYSVLTYLRVVFKTNILTNQTYTFDCQQYQVEPLSFDKFGSTLQYLSVVRDNVEFRGRFIDYSLADGRPTYSKTQLLSLTKNTDSNSTTSTAMIGLLLSQCKECILDPDFTPLLIDKGQDECGNSISDSHWRIIVGCVIGGIAAVGITTGSVMLIKKNRKSQMYENKMRQKLDSVNQK